MTTNDLDSLSQEKKKRIADLIDLVLQVELVVPDILDRVETCVADASNARLAAFRRPLSREEIAVCKVLHRDPARAELDAAIERATEAQIRDDEAYVARVEREQPERLMLARRFNRGSTATELARHLRDMDATAKGASA